MGVMVGTEVKVGAGVSVAEGTGVPIRVSVGLLRPGIRSGACEHPTRKVATTIPETVTSQTLPI